MQSNSNSTYLAANTYSGTGATTIDDAASDTIYGNQLNGAIDSSSPDLILQSAGSVGIGVTAPTSVLEIGGTHTTSNNLFEIHVYSLLPLLLLQ